MKKLKPHLNARMNIGKHNEYFEVKKGVFIKCYRCLKQIIGGTTVFATKTLIDIGDERIIPIFRHTGKCVPIHKKSELSLIGDFIQQEHGTSKFFLCKKNIPSKGKKINKKGSN